MENKRCQDMVEESLESRLQELRTLWSAEDQTTEELGSLNEYGLCLDYVEPNTFNDQPEGYVR